jgi:NADH:ubiquinone reductase (non-electrogenic)
MIEASNGVLGTFKQSLRDYSMRLFKRRQIEVLTKARVTEIGETSLQIMHDGNVRTVDFGLCVWAAGDEQTIVVCFLIAAAGIGPSEFLRQLPFEKLESNWRLKVDAHLRVPGHDDVFVCGDCAGTGLPSTGQAAAQQGAQLAANLNALAAARPMVAFKYAHYFTLAYVGRYRALLDRGPAKSATVRGIGAWLIWRAAYFTMLMSWSNKLLVPLFWLKSVTFGRDITKF